MRDEYNEYDDYEGMYYEGDDDLDLEHDALSINVPSCVAEWNKGILGIAVVAEVPLAAKIYHQLFSTKEAFRFKGEIVQITRTESSDGIPFAYCEIDGYKFTTQDTGTSSAWADLVRYNYNGEDMANMPDKIMWIIGPQTEPWKTNWVGMMYNDKLYQIATYGKHYLMEWEE